MRFSFKHLIFAAAAAAYAVGAALPAQAAASNAATVKTAAKTAKVAKAAPKKATAKKTSVNRLKASAKKVAIQKKRPVKRSKVRRAGMSPSQATLAGLRKTEDPLMLGSSVAYVMDQDTGEELVVKNADVPLPIASVTKLMTALVIAESDLSLDEKVRITREDYVRSTARSKMANGMRITREALLKAALMSSDNRAARMRSPAPTRAGSAPLWQR